MSSFHRKITFWWNKIILSRGLKHQVINQGRGSLGFLSVRALVWGGGPDKVGFGGGVWERVDTMWCLTPSPRKPPLPWPGLARSLSCRHWRCLLLSVPGPPRTPGKQLVLVGIGLWRRVGESSQSLRTVATRQGGVQYRHYFVWRLAWVIPDFAVCFKDLTSRPFRWMDDMFCVPRGQGDGNILPSPSSQEWDSHSLPCC